MNKVPELTRNDDVQLNMRDLVARNQSLRIMGQSGNPTRVTNDCRTT